MFYIIDTQGTTRAVMTEPIYQGSIGVNSITLLASFPSNVVVKVEAILPNGLRLNNLAPLTATIYPEGTPQMFDRNGKPYTAFSGIIDSSLTQQAGLVQIQFKVMLGVGKVLGTYKTSFNVSEGAEIENLPVPSAENYYDEILQYLTLINGKDFIKSVVYSSPDFAILPSSVSQIDFPSGQISTVPEATVANIDDPNNTLPFINVPTPSTSVAPSFTFEYENPISASIVQFYMIAPTYGDITINATTYKNNTVNGNYIIEIPKALPNTIVHPRIFLDDAEIDKIVFTCAFYDDPLYVIGVQVFTANVDGKYILTLENGGEIIIAAPDGNIIKSYAEQASASAQNAALSATEASQSASRAESAQAIAQGSAEQALTYAEQAEESKTTASNKALEASESAADAAESAQEALEALQTVLGKRRVFYESTMQLALNAIVNNTYVYASGDMFIIGEKNVPDLMLFSASDEPIDTAKQTITASQINSNTFTVDSGGRYKLENANGVIQWGVVAIESGFDPTNLVTIQQFSAALSSLDAVKQNKLQTTPSTVIGVNSNGEIVNFKIAQAVPGIETDGNSIVTTDILSQALGSNETELTESDLKLLKDITLEEDVASVTITLDKRVKEFFIRAFFSVNLTTAASKLLKVKTDGGLQYFVYQSMSLDNSKKHWICQAKESTERWWETVFQNARFSNAQGTEPRNAMLGMSYRDESKPNLAQRYVNNLNIEVDGANFLQGSNFKIYGKEVEE